MGLFRKRDGSPAPGQDPGSPRYGLLLVDDELFNLTTLAALLEDEFTVITAGSAHEALTLLSDSQVARQVQVVISDQRMPGMSGVELLAVVRERFPTIKRVLLTGYTDVDAIIGAINEAAIYKYLRKPVNSAELRLTLRRALESWQLEQDHASLLCELRHALDRLALLDAEKLDFLRYLDHEMRTPLNWVSAAQVVERESLSTDQRELLGFVDMGLARLRALVTAMLRYFQVASTRIEGPLLDMDLVAELKPLLVMAQQAEPDVRLVVDVPESVPLACQRQPRELLEHLLENGFTHARRAGQGEVHVRLLRMQGQIELTVHNSGPGLHGDVLEKIFRPFCRGSEHGDQGFGISMATARALAGALGGDLMAHSVGESAGVAMVLRLPERGAASELRPKTVASTRL